MLETLLSFGSNNTVQYQNVEYETYRFCIRRRARGDNLKKQRMLYAFIPDTVLKSNKIETSKYTILNFIPKLLQYQFSKLANVYFFIIAMMQCIRSISISDGKPVMLLPFSVIMGVSACKELLEDLKRHRQDRQENRGLVSRVDKQQIVQTQSRDLFPGHVIKIDKNQPIPADVVILKTSDVNGLCFVETMNLDGETNLKQRNSVKQVQQLTLDQLENRIQVTYEAPNRYLYQFNGKISSQEKDFDIGLTVANVLLKGSVLRNTEYVYGMIIYAGCETKVMMNSIDPSPKLSSLERQMNKLIIILFLIELILCLFSAILSYAMTHLKDGQLTYLYEVAESFENTNDVSDELDSFYHFILVKWGTWILIFTNFIPISLLVTLELVKFYQGFLVQNDTKYFYGVSVQSSSLNEELGQINHIFSDKTGTLTQNKMDFKNICVGGINYGQSPGETSKFQMENTQEISNSQMLRSSMIKAIPKKVKNVDFEDHKFLAKLQSNDKAAWQALYCLALCHNVIAEQPDVDDISKEIHFSAASPDELALVSFAKYSGLSFEGTEIKQNKEFYNIRNNILHRDEAFQILQVFEFDSTRKRFTIIIQNEKGEIELYTKGADNIIENLLSIATQSEKDLLEKTKKVTSEYATFGLRTLFLAKRTIPKDIYDSWETEYATASKELVEREQKMEKTRNKMECKLTLLGATAIEDKLQDEVPSTIFQFRECGIKFWVLTGDKKETAINISTAARIIDNDTNLIDLDAQTPEQLESILNNSLQSLSHKTTILKSSLIIQGETFILLEKNIDLAKLFVKLGLLTESVIGCRFSPKQKQAVVEMVRNNTYNYPTLAIGDGANDVNMILEAHVGVGIKGVEGSQASRASDFSITEFKQLKYLLFDFGRECYRRNSELVIYNFYKNVLLVLPQWWYGLFYNMFSGVSFYDPWLYQMYNTFYTALPIVIYALIDREHKQEDLFASSHFYRSGMFYEHFNVKKYLMNLLNGSLQSLVIMLAAFSVCENRVLDETGSFSFYAVTGMISFGVSVLVSNIKILTFSYCNTSYSLVAVFGSHVAYIVSYFLFTHYNIRNDLYKSFTLMNSNISIQVMIFLLASMFFMLDLAYQRYVDFQGIMEHNEFIAKHPPMVKQGDIGNFDQKMLSQQNDPIELQNFIPQKDKNNIGQNNQIQFK